jgi:ParB family chromosome partitioning protein
MARGLGRGFDSLIPTELIDEEFDPTAAEDGKASVLQEIDVEKIVRDEDQPRKDFSEEALEALANSIREHGILQPIVLVKEGKQYKIVAGERRWRAAKIVGLKTIPAIIRTLDAQNRLELSIIENAQREDLNAIELATAYAKLQSQFNLSPDEIAQRVGKSKSSIVNTMRLLALPDEAKKTMREHNLTEGVMRPLINADAEIIDAALPRIVDEGWTARRVERYVADHKKKSSAKAIQLHTYHKQEDALTHKYSTQVRITGRTLKFTCRNTTELNKLIEQLQK